MYAKTKDSDMNNNRYFISFLIPTYNASKYLERVIGSIERLDYPQNSVEIIAADGGSTDDTLKILSKHNVRVVQNKKRVAENGKFEAFKISKGDIIVFLDADNVIARRDWLNDLLKPFNEVPSVIGVESNYLIAKDFSSVNKYVTLLIIADPLARMLASKPSKIECATNYNLKYFSPGSTPVAGANGFLWRRSVLEEHAVGKHTLEETTILQNIATNSELCIANVPGQGIYHYYCVSFHDFIIKRQNFWQSFDV